MTVADLIEVLEQCRDLTMPVAVRVPGYDDLERLPLDDVREDRGVVVLETEP